MIMRFAVPSAIVVACIAIVPVTASTPAEWDAMNQRANRACVAMANLSRTVLLAQRVSFSDDIGIEIRQIRGRDERGRMKRLLCAFNRATSRTEVQEAGDWFGPTTAP